ncbi:MAG: L-threonate dehydrogenase [Hyphomicrobiales bacterium]
MSSNTTCAVIGLGSMGYGIAQSILRANKPVLGVDIDAGRMADLRAEGGMDDELKNLALKLDTAVIVVLNASQTEAVLFGDNALVPLMSSGAVVISCATVPPEFARQMAARCADYGVHYLDAPISGGAAKAAQGALSVMASGTDEAFTAAKPVLDDISETVFKLGDKAGAGSAMKAVNQLLAGVHIATMAEALTFGMTQGVEPKTFVEVISKCAGSSWMLENRAPHIVDGDYSPKSAVNIWLKDLGIVLDIAGSANFDAPISKAALAEFTKAADMGLGLEDDAAVAKVYADRAQLTLPFMDTENT